MYKLVSFNLCPYVQRSVILLNEKDISYVIEYIDLGNKPDWFLDMSPTGKVPVVQTPDGVILFESAVINEYLDETHPPHLMPGTPLERAQQRMWVEFTSTLFGDVYRLYNAGDEANLHRAVSAAKKKLDKIAPEVTGPFFAGEQLSLVDVAIAPAFMRLDWVDQIAPELEIFSNATIAAWKEALLARESVKNSVLPNLFDIFVDNLQKRRAWLATRLEQPHV